MKVLVYTCITNEKDKLQPVAQCRGVDYVCFTDNESWIPRANGWTCVKIPDLPFTLRMVSRHAKWLPFLWVPWEYDTSIWIDGNVLVRDGSFAFEAARCMNHGVAHAINPFYEHVKDELAVIRKNRGHLRGGLFDEQLAFYDKQGHDGAPMMHGKVIARDMRSPLAMGSSAAVWCEMVRWRHDWDQACIPYCYWRLGICPGILTHARSWPGGKITVIPHLKRGKKEEPSFETPSPRVG